MNEPLLDNNQSILSHQNVTYIFLTVIILLNIILMIYIMNFNTIISELSTYTPEIKQLIEIACYDLNCYNSSFV